MLAVFAALNFLRYFTGPEHNIRTVELLHLLGAGMCLGGAIIAGAAYFTNRPEQ